MKKQKRSTSFSSIGSGDGVPIMALCDGSVAGPSDGAIGECLSNVETLENSFAELRNLKVEIEAQTWSGKKPNSGKQL